MPLAFASALSTNPNSLAALDEVVALAKQQLQGEATVALLFVSADHLGAADKLAPRLCEQLGTDAVIGCSGESIVGVGTEIEMESAMSLWVASLPGSTVMPMRLEFVRTAEGGSFVGWPDELPDAWPVGSALLVLGDPYTFPPEFLLERVNDDHSGVSVIGGMASAATQPGENCLFMGPNAYHDGAVAVLIYGEVTIRSIVSQGCRPIGEHFVITKAERNVIQELGGLPAYQRLIEVYATLATHEQEMVRRGLHVGRVVSEYQDKFEQGDFLVRNVTGVDQESGAIVLGDYVRPGQTVQFHVRDANTADGELKQMLAALKQTRSGDQRGALLFTCNGRGTRLFPAPNHDAEAIGNALNNSPLAGFFAAGEMGPVAGRNFLHGFTASIAIFEAAQ
ncbi:MAG: FIST C-terminal domain-containing protein [Planctomycetaceae bacterium]|nr:FIST C-terminal domain-containing protein [Planctomycetales bacterium]MCB9922521.1 FIST C-terminal domain-containing protein [Planctomycetaceae bacterium]